MFGRGYDVIGLGVKHCCASWQRTAARQHILDLLKLSVMSIRLNC